MANRLATTLMTVSAVGLSGCASTAPRAFTPTVTPPPADPQAFETDFGACSAEVAGGKDISRSGDAGIAASAALSGAGSASLAGSGVALTGLGSSMGVAMGAAGFLGLLLLPAGIVDAKRKAKEKEIKDAMTQCLKARGHSVSRWKRVPTKDLVSVKLVTPVRRQPAATP